MEAAIENVRDDAFNTAENIRIDALTNRSPARIAWDIRSPGDLDRLRQRWSELDSIPRILIDRGEGVDHSWGGLDIRTLLLGEESSGRFSVHDMIFAPGSEFPACYLETGHVYIWIVDGALDLRIGDNLERSAGETFGYAPPGTRFGLGNPTAEPAQVVMLFSPAGSDRAFEAVHDLHAGADEPGGREIREVLGRFGFRFDDMVLANDGRVNLPAARLDMEISSIDDLFALRDRWSRQQPVPKLLKDISNAKTLPGIPSVPLTDGDNSAGHSICSLLSPQPGYRASLHHQPAEEELFYFLDGDYELTAGSMTVNVRRGTFAIAPRFASHGGINNSDRPVRFLGMNAPAGHERAYDMLMRERDPARLPELFKAYGFFLLEPVPSYHD